MSSRPPKRRKKNSKAFGQTSEPTKRETKKPGQQFDSNRLFLIGLFFVICIGGTYLVTILRDPGVDVPRYTYDVINEFDHDPTSFTQGFLFDEGLVWESTGLRGQSKVRAWNLDSGEIVKEINLEPQLWGEGLAVANDKLYQLTYTANKCLVYDRDLVKQEKEFEYEGQGWGLTFDGSSLIMSNGSSRLTFRDPETFEQKKVITVRKGGRSVTELNELEYNNGKIYANQLASDIIYEINPGSGAVESEIDLGKLWPRAERPEQGVLNGIAIDKAGKRLLVTGKLCPKVYEIELKLQSPE